MAVTFGGVAIFGVSVLRTLLEPRGALLVPKLALGSREPGSDLLGPLEVGVVIRGRVVAGTTASLEQRLGQIRLRLAPDGPSATLVDTLGRTYPDMEFVRLTLTGPVDRGRTVSQGIEARFVRRI
jgi:hypothetical protein